MLNNLLNQFKPELTSPQELLFDKKTLCIVEGKMELKYIYHLFTSFGFDGRCDSFVNDKVKVAWGKEQIKVQGYCNFQGGSQEGSKVPRPAQEAFEFEKQNLDLYSSVIILFDGDKDTNQEVENYFEDELKEISNDSFLLASKPCFESSLVDYCRCGNCRVQADSLEEERYPCDKYKNNFSKLECFEGADNLIVNLSADDMNYLVQNGSKLLGLNEMIKNKLN